MMDFLAGHFDLIRGLHIIFVMAWIAGMLILPRLFVYHMKTEPGSDMDAVFKLAELRTLRIIINPAMILALLMGLLLAMIDTQRLGPDFYLKPWALAAHSLIMTMMAGWIFSWSTAAQAIFGNRRHR